MLQVRVSPVMEDGCAVDVIWTHVDVTERHQEERLLELRNRALNYMSDGIFICDRQGSVLYTNQGFARLTGYEQRDAVGQPWTFLAVRVYRKSGNLPALHSYPGAGSGRASEVELEGGGPRAACRAWHPPLLLGLSVTA